MRKLIRYGFVFTAISLTSGAAWAADFKLNRYVSSTTYNTNSYWLESESGVALIDAQMLRSDANVLAGLIKSTGKPLKGVIITHAHFDHFSGLKMLRDALGDFPVYATRPLAAGMKSNHEATLSWAPDSYGNDYDKTLVEPDMLVKSGDTVNIAGIPLKIDDLGPGESESNLVIFQPDKNVLFSGDATLPGSHYYLGEGRSDKVLAQLTYLEKTYSDVAFIYSGHGDPARPAAIFKPEVEYVQFVRSLVKDALGKGELSRGDGEEYDEAALQSVIDALASKYPTLGEYGLSPLYIVKANIKGVLKEFEK